MVMSLKSLAEKVNRSTTDKKLADRIADSRIQIKREISARGFSVVEVDGKKFRVTSKAI
jgi:hypothetical protein